MGYDPDRTGYPADRGNRLCMKCGEEVPKEEASTDEYGQTVCDECAEDE